MMRRILLCWLMIGLLVVTVSAAGSEYRLEELGMSLELPNDFVVFTQDIQSDDPNLSLYGLEKDELSSTMRERSIYLNAWDRDMNFEIIVTMMENPLGDYNLLSDTELTAFVSSLDEDYESAGITIIRSELYQHHQAKFVKLYLSQPNQGETTYSLQFHTIYDGKAINMTMHSYSGDIGSDHEAILQAIVDSAHFDAEPQYHAPPAETEAFLYTDPDSGMTFTVPANWVEAPMTEERQWIDVKFASNLDEGLTILFTSQDVFELEDIDAELSAVEKFLLSRADIENHMITKAGVAEMYGCEEADVRVVTYGGKEYYMAEIVASDTIYGMTISMPMVALMRIENGYFYLFQFFGPASSAYFKDFEALVASAVYPEIADELTSHRISVVLSVIGVVALVAVCVLLHRRKTRNRSVVFAPFCHKCGTKCAPGGRYCPKCGTKLVSGEEHTWDIT